MLKLIVHADDFGLTEKINEGILDAYLHGILTSTSIMPNGPAFEHAIRICQVTPNLDVGIHLTLVEEKPILNRNVVASLVDANGKFYQHATIFIKKYFSRTIRLSDIRYELEAQIKKVISCGLNISHLDSHQHLHMLPQLFRITSELAKKYGIKRIRFPRERLRFNMLRKKNSGSRILQLLVLNLLCRRAKNDDLLKTDHFVGFFFGGNLNKVHLKHIILQLPSIGTCELMCHPGTYDTNTSYKHWGYNWSDELKALIDPEIFELLELKKVHLISYGEL